MTNPSTLGPQAALIYVMVTVSAADSDMTDAELRAIGDLVRSLPVFHGFDEENLVPVAEQCAAVLAAENGLEAVLDQVRRALSAPLRETAYAVACEVAAADGVVPQEELRLLEMLRHRLEIERLVAAAIERGVAALLRSG